MTEFPRIDTSKYTVTETGQVIKDEVIPTANGIQWHYVKDGDLPKENEYIMIYSKLADNIAVGKRRCAGKIRKRCVYEWYFATYEGTYCLRDKDIIAWKEIVLPKGVGKCL